MPASPQSRATPLRWFDGQPETYRRWATTYYERPVSSAAVEAVYAHLPLTTALVNGLNAELALADLKADADEIGYPEPRSVSDR